MRKGLTKKGSKALFKATANKTKARNLPAKQMMRGGFHF